MLHNDINATLCLVYGFARLQNGRVLMLEHVEYCGNEMSNSPFCCSAKPIICQLASFSHFLIIKIEALWPRCYTSFLPLREHDEDEGRCGVNWQDKYLAVRTAGYSTDQGSAFL